MAGAINFDKLCHRIFSGGSGGKDYLKRDTHVCCGTCGRPLFAYYCEEQLYLIECEKCEKKALVKARNPKAAAYKTFAHEVIPIDDMGEELAVFFGTVPICDPPYYVGSTIDSDFPDDLKCAMLLPCPGTDAPEVE